MTQIYDTPLPSLAQDPLAAGFVQNPYPFYDQIRAAGPFVYWREYDLAVSARADVVGACLRDRRLGREAPAGFEAQIAPDLAPFYEIEAHSMLELDGARHATLRRQVLREFTSARIATLAPDIEALAHRLIDDMPQGGCDLIGHFATPLPVQIIARLLGVPLTRTDDLLDWSHAMVGMYQAQRSPAIEARAVAASRSFHAYLTELIAQKRLHPEPDLISALATDTRGHLSTPEIIATAILLLNAGHEATVHTLGNGLHDLLATGRFAHCEGDDPRLIEEILRHDPPLHLFLRWVKEDFDLSGHQFRKGDRIGLLLAGANRDADQWHSPETFDPERPVQTNFSFGAGPHFCLGAPLARMEISIALRVLRERLPQLALAAKPRYSDIYPFHGLERLDVTYDKT
ncbi:cytochrome P450 [Rhodobacteraceae bacterium]|nr:cytochrome P450 [Paracoccaceae bacterium]